MSAVLENSFTDKAFRYDIETYHKLSATGILPRNTELIHGVVVKKMTISPKHSKVVTKLGPILAQAISENRIVRQEKPITIGDSEPETDISAVEGTYNDFGNKHPETELQLSILSDDFCSFLVDFKWRG